jgi:hypothetical protein
MAPIAFKLIAGALAGGILGFFLGKIKACSAGECRSAGGNLALRVFYVLSMAFFGAAIAWYLAR